MAMLADCTEAPLGDDTSGFNAGLQVSDQYSQNSYSECSFIVGEVC